MISKHITKVNTWMTKQTPRHEYKKKFLNDQLFNEKFSIEELNEAIKKLKTSKLPGTEKVFPQFVKTSRIKCRKLPFKYLQTSVENQETCPRQWIKAIVVPIPKAKKPEADVRNYRPVSLTSM